MVKWCAVNKREGTDGQTECSWP